MADANKIELINTIYQFLCHEVENSTLSESAKESLTVAAECIEQAYSLTKPQSERSPSDELLKIFTSAKQPQQQNTQTIYPNLFGSTSSSVPNPTSTENATPKVRKNPTEEERKQAEELKNQGNELMKQDKYKEAYDSYTRAIELDNNNAVYYSNRAASLSKLSDHEAALKDCLDAIEIDPTYSKAYGRMGLAYASVENHAKAKEAYEKAVQLDPNNQSYQNNLKIAEEKLRAGPTGQNPSINPSVGMFMDGWNTAGVDIASVLQNPDTISTIMRRMQDPNMQNIFNTLMSASANLFNPATGGSQPASGNQETTTTSQTAADQQTPPAPQQATNQENSGQTAAPQLGVGNILAAGQQIASVLQAANPNMMADLTRMFAPPRHDNPDNSDQNPPPGYS